MGVRTCIQRFLSRFPRVCVCVCMCIQNACTQTRGHQASNSCNKAEKNDVRDGNCKYLLYCSCFDVLYIELEDIIENKTHVTKDSTLHTYTHQNSSHIGSIFFFSFFFTDDKMTILL